ncbi:MAG: TrkA family potassium uptake protein [Candidatus Cloacimonetes bacterium]|nr:TrkA family potassium uptake protein [Candidatus Cloacimonadota bacterium]
METNQKSLYIIIIGCGRLGSLLANMLSKEGHSTVIIDNNIHSFDALNSTEFSGFQIEGDATELSVLKEAKIDKADILIGATHDDNINIMIGQIAKRVFTVPNVLIRILDQNKEPLLQKIDIKYVCTTTEIASKIIELI